MCVSFWHVLATSHMQPFRASTRARVVGATAVCRLSRSQHGRDAQDPEVKVDTRCAEGPGAAQGLRPHHRGLVKGSFGRRERRRRQREASDQEDGAYDAKVEGHTKCCICSTSSKSTSWAATRTSKHTGETTPLGNICEPCYTVFRAKRTKDMNTVTAFAAKAQKSAQFRHNIEQAKAVASGQAKDFSAEHVSDIQSFGYEMQSFYVVLSEKDLARFPRKQCATRVPKYITRDLITCSLPSATSPGTRETHYLFRHPDRP